MLEDFDQTASNLQNQVRQAQLDAKKHSNELETRIRELET